ncbi:MAG: twin-arginine translocation signal domain-containing protein [Pirellulaceae bacterium]|nr:twin-arginine translocation signal domain-containing protein [Pirellulaceae bacterium]
MFDRREFLKASSLATASLATGSLATGSLAGAAEPATQLQTKLAAPDNAVNDTVVELPRLRVPLSFIIDDSTSLVNMGRFCMPQFAEAWPGREEYDRPWQSWPAEIPDDFLRRFGTWCAEQNVRGKFSMVPYPACVGWLDREIPGWSRQALQASLKLVRDVIVPNWDIHPEMITHTRVIDIKTGRPIAEINPGTMENSFPQVDKSVDELASYLAYALRILKNCDLPCEGITTPGGFGNKVKDKLPLAVFEAVRDVYGSELPHYFKYVSDGDEPTIPRLEALRDLNSDQPRVTVNVPAGTGDWFGGWDGVRVSEGPRYANHDATSGRMVELIERGQPAVMLCHWPGLYGNGSEVGFQHFQSVVLALASRFGDKTRWMKISDIGRYWTAKELTTITRQEKQVRLNAPFGCADFTLRIRAKKVDGVVQPLGRPTVQSQPFGRDTRDRLALKQVPKAERLEPGHYWMDGTDLVVCWNLIRGQTVIET